ncbi:MAG: hypothetical protein ACR2IV_01260 [Bryobacteraceae bacterium]
MRLLWTFMGASTAYTFFSGLAEATAGLLLLFRRTTTLGALAAGAVQLNIVMLNFCYDVPVKLYSVHLLLMSLFLLLPDAAALRSFFLLHRPSRLGGVWLPKFERRWLRNAALALQMLVVVSVLYNTIWSEYKMSKERAAQSEHLSLLYGVWDVDSFTPTGSPAAAVPDNSRWRRMIVNSAGYLVVRTDAGEAIGFESKYDEPKHDVKLSGRRNKQAGEFTYSQPDDQHLMLRGNLDHNPVVVAFHRYKTGQFLLTSRGFHWINE